MTGLQVLTHADRVAEATAWGAAHGAAGARELIRLATERPLDARADHALWAAAQSSESAEPFVRSLTDHWALGLSARSWLQRVGADPLPDLPGSSPTEKAVTLFALLCRHPEDALAVLAALGPQRACAIVESIGGVDWPAVDRLLAALAEIATRRVARAARRAEARRRQRAA